MGVSVRVCGNFYLLNLNDEINLKRFKNCTRRREFQLVGVFADDWTCTIC